MGSPSSELACSLSMIGPSGRQHLCLAVRPQDQHGVTLVAVHYSVNGGPQWNVDIRSPDTSGDWVHSGVDMPDAPVIAGGDLLEYWVHVVRNGLGKNYQGFTWRASAAGGRVQM